MVRKQYGVVLTANKAMEIYSIKLQLSVPNSYRASLMSGGIMSVPGLSRWVAGYFGVSPKTVRDIWNGRTWKSVTRSFDGQVRVSHASVEVPPCMWIDPFDEVM